MKESMWGYLLIFLGIGVITLMLFFQNYTTTSQHDYYLVKEITNAAMQDAVDYGYYKKYGELKINKEKFVENFIKRFSKNITLNKNYKVRFYSIYETPPTVSLEIISTTGDVKVMGENIDSDIVTRITAVLETDDLKNELETGA